jgi:hypothetical protein
MMCCALILFKKKVRAGLNFSIRTNNTNIIICLWSHLHDYLTELVIIRWELLILLFQCNELLRLGVWYWWRASNSWDTTSQTQVFSRSVGEPVDPIFIGSTRRSRLHPQIWIKIWMGRRIVPISLPQSAIIGFLKIPSVKKSSNAIQENNNLQNKMNERTYHKVLSTVVHELPHPLLAILTPHMHLYKQLHWTRFTSKRRNL